MEGLYVHSLDHSLRLVLVYGVRQLSNDLIMLFSSNGFIAQMREF